MTPSATCRTRPSSSNPFDTHKRNNCLASRAACLLVFISFVSLRLHLLGRFFGQAPLIFGRQNLARDRRGRVHHQTSDLTLEFSEHACVVLGGRLSRLDDDLFGRGDGLLSFLLLHPGGRQATFLDEFGRLGIGLGHHLLTLGLGPSQFGLYFFRVSQSLGDLLTPLL